ncbi:hypothetical protein [Arthrobacter sp. Br18]|uniref:hypothetical protein n=1 Tax=Arthrobacter sp. Br18 TaxID=1312954 RepID=UPI0004BB5F50|nr:hypothetical protein [Arthrobacter sp. Br18]
MNRTSRLTPDEEFPEDLPNLDITEVEVLNSKVHREIDVEYIEYGLPDPETQARLAELTEELDRRDEETAGMQNPGLIAESRAASR